MKQSTGLAMQAASIGFGFIILSLPPDSGPIAVRMLVYVSGLLMGAGTIIVLWSTTDD